MACNDSLRVQAYFDGELDSAGASEIERHMESCPECAALFRDLETTSQQIREHTSYYRADHKLRSRVWSALDKEAGGRNLGFDNVIARGRQFWTGAASGTMATTLAAALAFFILLPPSADPIVNDVMTAHLRSLMSDHLIDVASSDRHTVKPWFNGHTDVSPPAADFVKEGYRLVGGRVDYVDGQRAAVVVYRYGAHVINVFTWADDGKPLPHLTTRNGYHAVFWKSGNLVFCAVSDMALDSLLELTRLLRAMTTPDGRE